jgi:hypothetical protein
MSETTNKAYCLPAQDIRPPADIVFIEVGYASLETGCFETIGLTLGNVRINPKDRTDENAEKLVKSLLPPNWVYLANFISEEEFYKNYI